MKRYILTTYDKGVFHSMSYIDASAALKAWVVFNGSTTSWEEWMPGLLETGRAVYMNLGDNDFDSRMAFISLVEIY